LFSCPFVVQEKKGKGPTGRTTQCCGRKAKKKEGRLLLPPAHEPITEGSRSGCEKTIKKERRSEKDFARARGRGGRAVFFFFRGRQKNTGAATHAQKPPLFIHKNKRKE
jgi:hypothetical protein